MTEPASVHTTPADTLLRAATLLREYADAASRPGAALVARALLVAAPNPAAMHPGVGAALADWLETEAASTAGDEDHSGCAVAACATMAAAATAQALLGEGAQR